MPLETGAAEEVRMPLPDTFHFSQQSLQDYADCRRRFQLRYLLMQPWPALVTGAPVEFEALLQRGADFHRLAHQYALGLDPQRLEAGIRDDELLAWWHTFLAHPPQDLPGPARRAEVVLSAGLPATQGTSRRLVARVDLLAAEPGARIVVVDWKTMHRRPRRAELARRLQTRVYRYLAVEATAAIFGGRQPAPEQVEMIYWFAAHGGQVERFPYNAGEYAADRADLAALAAEILAQQAPIWPLTEDIGHCRFCHYRSLCEREVEPGFPDELPDDVEPEEIEIDLEQIGEVVF
jgi:hypothetical protein